MNWAGQIDTQNILDIESKARILETELEQESKRDVSNSILLKELKAGKKEFDSPFSHDDSRKADQIETYSLLPLV